MGDQISPALTPEEWEAFRGWLGLWKHRDAKIDLRMAAERLYGQPFGFTREDVAFLQSLAAWHHTQTYGKAAGWRQSVLSEVVELRNLADRIAALLPPETP